MSTTDTDLDKVVRSWVRAPESASTDRILDAVLAEVDATPQRRRSWHAPWLAFGGSPLPIGLSVVAVLMVALVALTLQAGGQFPGGSPASAEPPATDDEGPITSDPGAIMGLPPAGATPSDPTPSELVLRFEPSTPWMQSWLFADGRLLTFRHGGRPTGAGDEYIGMIEQRLTASGVEFLTSEVVDTGLFEDDLALLWEGTGFLNMDVRNGDRLVALGWGHRAWGGPWLTAPTATPAQAQALRGLTDLLSRQDAWPESAWADRTQRSYVPSFYGICVRGVPDGVDPDEIWDQLPQAGRDLRDAAQVPAAYEGDADDNYCTPMTIGDARALTRILTAAGIERQLPRFDGEIWLRYEFEDPNRRGNTLWISFAPILPHGEAIWLGPG
jgi:hypothetical protein